MDFYIGVFSFTAIYAILAMSYTLVHGTTGMFTVAHAVFFGVGAYASAVISHTLPPQFMIVGVISGAIVAGVAAAIIGLVSLKERGQYMMLVTFSTQIIFSVFLTNNKLLGGEDGWSTITPFQLGSLVVKGSGPTLTLLCVISALLFGLFSYIERSTLGRTLRAIREDELAVEAVGVNVHTTKWIVFIFSGAMAGLAGALFAHLTRYISPNSFNFDAAILIVTISVLGGQFSYFGAIVGAIVVAWLPIAAGYLGVESSKVGAFIQLIFGLCIIIMLYFRPAGFIGERQATFADPRSRIPEKA